MTTTTPRTEEQKSEMLRLRDEEKLSNQQVADVVGITGKRRGDIVRKVLARYTAGKKQPASNPARSSTRPIMPKPSPEDFWSKRGE